MSNTKTVILGELPKGAIFKIGTREFISFGEENGGVYAVLKESAATSQFGKNNNFAESKILEQLTKDFLPEIENIVGAENVLEFETDLLSLDGSAQYGVIMSRISLPTFDFYRKNRAIFEQHKLDEWWWLSTPDSTPEWNTNYYVNVVSPSGIIYYYCCDYYYGVRPFLSFKSSIFVSCDEE